MGVESDPRGSGPRGSPTGEAEEPDPADLRGDTRFYFLVAGGLAVAVALVAVLAGSLGEGVAASTPTAGSGSSPSAHTPSPAAAPPHQDADTRFLATYGTGYPDRWNPCEPIHWVVNLQSAPAGAMPSVFGAIRRVSKATGIRFEFDGQTRTTPVIQVTSQMRAPSGAWRPLLISWGDRSLIVKLTHDPIHVGAVGVPRPGSGPTANEYVSGVVIVNGAIDIPLGFGVRWSLGVVLMHELGHVMGLAHVPSAHEIMWSPNVVGAAPRPDIRQSTYGSGDLAGLRALGHDAGCLPSREDN